MNQLESIEEQLAAVDAFFTEQAQSGSRLCYREEMAA
jgi:hypothetical protein